MFHRGMRGSVVFSQLVRYDDTMGVLPALGKFAYLHVPEMDAT
jgi:hypothetical protein